MESDSGKLLIGVLIGAALGAGSAVLTWRADLLKLGERIEQLERRLKEIDHKLRPELRRVIFSENFTSNMLGWDIGNSGRMVRRIANGKYYFEVRTPDCFDSGAHALSGPLGDFTATLKAQWVNGGGDGHFGLALGWDRKNLALLGLTPENYSKVLVIKNGDQLPDPLVAKSISNINRSNITIRVTVRGKMAIYYLDDKKVGQFPVKDFDLKRIGVYVCGRQSVEFDSLVVVAEA